MRELTAVALLVVHRQQAQVGEGALADAAGEAGLAVHLAAVFGQIPGMLEGLRALVAVEGTLARVCQLVPLDVRSAREHSAAGVARVPSARVVIGGGRRIGFAGFPCAIRAGGKRFRCAGRLGRTICETPEENELEVNEHINYCNLLQ